MTDVKNGFIFSVWADARSAHSCPKVPPSTTYGCYCKYMKLGQGGHRNKSSLASNSFMLLFRVRLFAFVVNTRTRTSAK